ncbi:DNA (cytosine-5)-methyltransferase 1 [Pseudochrobactrum saccharolyticum]|uniref:Cytosine-specific methyltransferase n=1 Tax=Pseudochrobactrum saccharolyticum TaxID=354352 RepID=A0A7W8ERG1_9HYPH|nr:DNA (cytosine-5-)-methyltransferase [Pseudochrobactrum saccharolyticum]MBB5092593.1 DNA (cytosine-5)-methyltransferase 1 [Pseudochrobactrum saccharolyticum]
MRAIDLYSGIGGWSLGLKLAGIDVVASYEWWQPAIDTHNGNHNGNLTPINIRNLKIEDLPKDIDIVVGSPPCTEFSYANRGGKGNVAEGMKDLVKFLEIVEYLRPQYWALENVPRVADVLHQGFLNPDHPLYRFKALKPEIEVIDFSDYGTAQARKRCIAGNIPFDLLKSYANKLPSRTLGDVVNAFKAIDNVADPHWGVILPAIQVTETQEEVALNAEELRMNREAKTFHPVYNNMAFPDNLNQRARTVTATCTRVSRESIVIENPKIPGSFRRLTIRERASLQGFPITYQFFGRSFAEKAKMVGNAIPPTFTYLLAQAAKKTALENLKNFHDAGISLELPLKLSKVTPLDKEGKTYPTTRSFRAALPYLRFKSGMRFDLSNEFQTGNVNWKVRFYFGPSKDIHEVTLDGSLEKELRASPLIKHIIQNLQPRFEQAQKELWTTSPAGVQASWSHRNAGLGPYEVVDILGELADYLYEKITQLHNDAHQEEQITAYVLMIASENTKDGNLPGQKKIEKNATRILSGLFIADWFNNLPWHNTERVAA